MTNDTEPTIERTSRDGVLERGRPDGLGQPSDDQPNLPSRQPIRTPPNFTKKRGR
jgi:hypothetical protein